MASLKKKKKSNQIRITHLIFLQNTDGSKEVKEEQQSTTTVYQLFPEGSKKTVALT